MRTLTPGETAWNLMFYLIAFSYTLVNSIFAIFSFQSIAYTHAIKLTLLFCCSGSIGARLSTDAAAVKSMFADTLALVVQNIGTVVCGLTIAFISNWQLSLLVLALVPLLGSQGYFQMKMMQGFSNDAKVCLAFPSLIVFMRLQIFVFASIQFCNHRV